MKLLPVTVGIVVLGLPAILWYRSHADRRTFLHTMHTRGALPDVGATVCPDELALQNYENKIDDRKALQFQASFEGSETTTDPNA